MEPEFAHLMAGLRDPIDVWALFQSDAQSRTGLYPGELVRELSAERPDLLPQIVDALRRGLVSEDARERVAALHGVTELPRPVDLGKDLASVCELAPESVMTRPFLYALALQPSTDLVKGLVDRVLARPCPPDAEGVLASAFKRHRPSVARDTLVAALALEPAPAGSSWLRELASAVAHPHDALFERFAPEREELRKRASDLFFAAYKADQRPGSYDGWLQVHLGLGLAAEGVPARPFESEAERALRARYAAMRAELEAAERAPAAVQPAKAPAAVVLAPPVWLDALRIPEGPPVELFDLLRRHSVKVLRSNALLDAIDAGLRQLGWADAARASARARVVAASVDGHAGDDASEVALAQAAGLSMVYTVGPEAGTSHGTVSIRPVHELLSLFKQV